MSLKNSGSLRKQGGLRRYLISGVKDEGEKKSEADWVGTYMYLVEKLVADLP